MPVSGAGRSYAEDKPISAAMSEESCATATSPLNTSNISDAVSGPCSRCRSTPDPERPSLEARCPRLVCRRGEFVQDLSESSHGSQTPLHRGPRRWGAVGCRATAIESRSDRPATERAGVSPRRSAMSGRSLNTKLIWCGQTGERKWESPPARAGDQEVEVRRARGSAVAPKALGRPGATQRVLHHQLLQHDERERARGDVQSAIFRGTRHHVGRDGNNRRAPPSCRRHQHPSSTTRCQVLGFQLEALRRCLVVGVATGDVTACRALI